MPPVRCPVHRKEIMPCPFCPPVTEEQRKWVQEDNNLYEHAMTKPDLDALKQEMLEAQKEDYEPYRRMTIGESLRLIAYTRELEEK